MLEIFFHEPSLFSLCALFGTLLFVLQLITSLFDGGDGAEFELTGIQWLSKQTLTGFAMMFGWTGLACTRECALSYPLSLFFALLAGTCALILTALLFRAAARLKSRGYEFRIDSLVGKEAEVYQRIPSSGSGKITVSLNGITHEVEARSHSGQEIDSFARVRIIHKHDDKTVAVIPLGV